MLHGGGKGNKRFVNNLFTFFPGVIAQPNQPSQRHRASKHIELYAVGWQAAERPDAEYSLPLYTSAGSRKHSGCAGPESGPSSKLGNLTWQKNECVPPSSGGLRYNQCASKRGRAPILS